MPLIAALSLSLAGCSEVTSPESSVVTQQGDQPTAEVLLVANKPKDEQISFNRDIRPILSENCFFCHGPDKNHQEADLRLDFFEPATRDLGGYQAIVPGDREESETWHRIIDKDDPMPPAKSHKKLTKEQIDLIGRWIDQGANYEAHWSYTKVAKPDPPEVKNEQWVGNTIDRFILAELEARGIEPSPQADKRTLLRRVTFDLTGLPPTPEQAEAFMKNASPQAYENYVDELLTNEAYGEHLAVWWLDQVRFADTIGFHSDNPRNVWPYRDWVIRSLNENMPFDRFTVMQLAGDLMQDEPTTDMLVASAYNRLNPTTEEGGAQRKEYQAIYDTDRVTNYGEVWLGSSTGCAQCHDHKFDPITMEDFYRLAAFFGSLSGAAVSVERGYPRHEPPYIFLPQNEEEAQQIADVESRYREMIEAQPEASLVEEYFGSRGNARPPLPEGVMPEYGKAFEKLLNERKALADKITTIPIARDLKTPRTVRILERGNWQDETGEVVLPATPAFLGGPASTQGSRLNRLDLAKWTVSPDNPLMARAITNRLWAKYLGNPLSSNTIDLGSQGTLPTHPLLLDYLASEFRDSGWGLKHVIRQIVTSETYKQSSDTRAELADVDPNNRKLFARQSAMRLTAETLRDQVLAVSGLLTEKIGGPSVFPYQPEGHWEPLNFPRRKWPTSKGEDLYRKSLYTWVQRTFPHPLMTAFDATSRESCIGQRMVSTTPLQALGLLNGPTFVESARVLAQRLVAGHANDAQRLDTLYSLVLARAPRGNERTMLTALLASQREHFTGQPEEAAKLAAMGQSPPAAPDLDPVDVAAWTSICRVVLNLHETITRN
ncbi:MAG: PSD1 and planctomycete cytochrome C domain-containing protein [Planctomycetota bacterium]